MDDASCHVPERGTLLGDIAYEGWKPQKERAVLRLTSQEIAFLRWLRTNGGRGLLRTREQFALADRVIRAGYVNAAPSQEEIPYTLTDLGREALALEGF